MRTIHGIRMLALLLGVCPQAVAQDKTFLEKILSAAEVGNIDAQFRAGSLYATGQGTTKDLTLAFQWWSKAAEHGHTQAQFNVGLMHARRLVPYPAPKPAVRRDDSMLVQPSVPLGVKSAALPVDVARQLAVIQGELGQVYDYQKGFFQGFAELPAEARTQALAWWRKAAEKGHAQAQANLGHVFWHSLGRSQDVDEAWKWYQMAAAQNHLTAQYMMGRLYESEQSPKKDSSLAELWYRKAAERGHVYAMFNLGRLHDSNEGSPKKANHWYRKAAALGHAQAHFYIAHHLDKGRGVTPGSPGSFPWHYKAALLGDAASQTALGEYYSTGRKTRPDASESFRWYYMAAQQGDPMAQLEVGTCYAAGKGVSKDAVEAYKWYVLSEATPWRVIPIGSTESPKAELRRNIASLALSFTPPQKAEAALRIEKFEPKTHVPDHKELKKAGL